MHYTLRFRLGVVVWLLALLIRDAIGTSVRLPLAKRSSSYKSLLYNDEGTEYLVPIAVGNPRQRFLVAIDTGSSDLWLPSVDCTDCPHDRFNYTNSSTFNNMHQPFSIVYGIGHVDGFYGQDTVRVAGIQVDQQQFGLAHYTKDIIFPANPWAHQPNMTANGILGLGFPSLTKASSQGKPYNPFVFALMEQGHIREPIFSIVMGTIRDDGWAGEILFGDVHGAYRDSVLFAPLATTKRGGQYTYWMVLGSKLSVSDAQGRVKAQKEFLAPHGFIIDTGTTLTYMDEGLAQAMVYQVVDSPQDVHLDTSTGTYIIDCGAADTDRQLQLDLAMAGDANQSHTLQVTLPMRDLVLPIHQQETKCLFGIAPWIKSSNNKPPNQNGMPLVLVGDSILRSLYLVFDMQQQRIGFAPLKDEKVGNTTVRMTSGPPQKFHMATAASAGKRRAKLSMAATYGWLTMLLFMANTIN
ncbi:aspartic peptidase domain-containing protein [Gongronella butleri]|nr:aspartic peptidase domain-containing protein [Gongronella butleri]